MFYFTKAMTKSFLVVKAKTPRLTRIQESSPEAACLKGLCPQKTRCLVCFCSFPSPHFAIPCPETFSQRPSFSQMLLLCRSHQLGLWLHFQIYRDRIAGLKYDWSFLNVTLHSNQCLFLSSILAREFSKLSCRRTWSHIVGKSDFEFSSYLWEIFINFQEKFS